MTETGTERVSAHDANAATSGWRRLRIRVIPPIPPIWLVLTAVAAIVVWRDPLFAEPASLAAFLKRSAPLLVLALGQLFVIVAGEFDLSVGALMTACVVIAARVGEGDPNRTWWIILLLVGLGLLVGLVNGVVTVLLRVPSFITTLGAMFVLSGAVFLWTGGSPTGALAENLRQFGRSTMTGVPLLGSLPYAVLVVVVVAVLATVLLHHTRFGHQLFAVGGGVRAAMLSGVDVWRIRTAGFVISALSAVVAAVLLAGFAGLSADAGAGYEFQAITAVVLGGAVLGGGRGTTAATMGGALTLQALFTLLNLFGYAKPLRDSAEGLLIIAAGAYTAYRTRRSG
ncbi:ABC transporter permease [Streptomyces sp. KR80]|uniref:ABC transporter permease n=1 Tax=Streptomyces sp. KR80 TaxID=3457426 RepID=UPI003FD40111